MMRQFSVILLLLTIFCNAVFAGERTGRKTDDIYDVIIVGGGFSGLTAAYNLKDKNILVLEKEEELGGRCLSGKWNGFHYPKGTEYIGEPDDYLKELLKELGIVAEKIPAPTDGVAYNGKFYFGKEILNFLTDKEKKQYYALLKRLDKMNKRGIEDVIFEDQLDIIDYEHLDNQSVKEWLTRNGYSELIQKFFDIENRGLFGTDNSNYSMLFDIPEMAFNFPVPSSINESVVYSFNRGMYSIIEALNNHLRNRVISGAYVNRVVVNSDKTVTVSYVKSGTITTVKSKAVIMATPAPVTELIVDNHLSTGVRNTLSGIKYSKYATVNLFLKKRLLHETWSVSCIDEGEVVTLYDAIRPQVDSTYRGRSILSVYMAPEYAYDKGFTGQSDRKLLNSVYATLNRYYPGFEGNVLGYDITRFEYAFPIFSPNYGNNIRILLKDRTVRGPIFLAGDYMMYATVDGAFFSGKKAAERVLEYLK
jgi:protoporphyrinogen oxidase